MTVIQSPSVQLAVNLLQQNLVYACDNFTPRVQSQEIKIFILEIKIGQAIDILGYLGIFMNFNDQAVKSGATDAFPMNDIDAAIYD
jgi:hypothetical protein